MHYNPPASLVKNQRLWYTVAMKALFFSKKGLLVCQLISVITVWLCCAPVDPLVGESPYPEQDEEAEPSVVEYTVYSTDGESHAELFTAVWDSEHAIAYVSAHAISETAARELLEGFEERIFPRLPFLPPLNGQKIHVLLTHLMGQTRRYTLFPVPEQGPTICLNAVYPSVLEYALAHEYQHLCAYYACAAGKTVLSEKTDELLSDIFCELVCPDQETERSILSEQRIRAAREKLNDWGEDALLHVYELLRKGYAEDELLSVMENR